MAEISQYMAIMTDGLNKKSVLLDAISETNDKLEQVIGQTEMDMEQFKACLDAKDEYTKEIQRLDEGFQSLFDKIADEVRNNKEKYRQQILDMQRLIREITDKAVRLQETEGKQRMAIETQFSKMRKKLRVARKGVNVAQNYYKNMSNLNIVDAQFLDQKK